MYLYLIDTRYNHLEIATHTKIHTNRSFGAFWPVCRLVSSPRIVFFCRLSFSCFMFYLSCSFFCAFLLLLLLLKSFCNFHFGPAINFRPWFRWCQERGGGSGKMCWNFERRSGLQQFPRFLYFIWAMNWAQLSRYLEIGSIWDATHCQIALTNVDNKLANSSSRKKRRRKWVGGWRGDRQRLMCQARPQMLRYRLMIADKNRAKLITYKILIYI